MFARVYSIPSIGGGARSALKVMRYTGSEAGAWAADFVREVSIWASVQPHANVVEFLGVGCVGEGGPPAISLEMVGGSDLYHVIHDAPAAVGQSASLQPLSWSIAFRLNFASTLKFPMIVKRITDVFRAAAAIARALKHLHNHVPPVIHRFATLGLPVRLIYT